MKTIKVVAAVICDNMKEKNKIFATARGYGELKGGWARTALCSPSLTSTSTLTHSKR